MVFAPQTRSCLAENQYLERGADSVSLKSLYHLIVPHCHTMSSPTRNAPIANQANFIVNRAQHTQCDLITTSGADRELSGPGQLRLKILYFSLTANNVTYAILNKKLPYLDFFPVPDERLASQWGCLPVWGIAVVESTTHPEIPVGTKVYGLFPAATYVTFKRVVANSTGFKVERPWIPPHCALYNVYYVENKDPFHIPGRDDTVVFRPLFLTGVLLADFLNACNFKDASNVIISSASSKTSYGLAKALVATKRCNVIGISSSPNVAFSRSLGVYDQIISYEDVTSALPPTTTAVYVDVAGNVSLRATLAKHLGQNLRLVLAVGLTHGSPSSYTLNTAQTTPTTTNPTPPATSAATVPSQVFFAPGWMDQRHKELGISFAKGLLNAWRMQMADVEKHFRVQRKSGANEIKSVYLDLAMGKVMPDVGFVVGLDQNSRL